MIRDRGPSFAGNRLAASTTFGYRFRDERRVEFRYATRLSDISANICSYRSTILSQS